jgi:hypothetical protein
MIQPLEIGYVGYHLWVGWAGLSASRCQTSQGVEFCARKGNPDIGIPILARGYQWSSFWLASEYPEPPSVQLQPDHLLPRPAPELRNSASLRLIGLRPFSSTDAVRRCLEKAKTECLLGRTFAHLSPREIQISTEYFVNQIKVIVGRC